MITYFTAAAIAFPLCLVAIFILTAFFWRCRNSSRIHISLLEEASNISGYGLVLFDHHENFMMANKLAHSYLPILQGDESTPRNLKGFLDYMFDAAVDDDEGLRNALEQSGTLDGDVGFREVILGDDDRLYLAEARKMQANHTALTFTDISRLKKREEQVLQLSRFNYELYQAVEATANGILVLNLKEGAHEIIFANKALCHIFEVEPHEIIGRDIEALFSDVLELDIKKMILALIKTRTTGELDISLEGRGQVDDKMKSLHSYGVHLTPVDDAAGEPNLFIGVFTDTSMLKLREAELSKSQKLEALGQMAAGVSHDFNNLLSIIDGYARLIETGLEENSPLIEHLGRIRNASARGAGFVRQMLTFSRHKIVVEDVLDLNVFIQEQGALFEPILDAQIDFITELHPDPIVLECSGDHLSQILMNLVVNARDAMPGGGRLLVETSLVDPKDVPLALQNDAENQAFACLRVSDTGTGIPQEVIDKIFDPFFTTKEQGKGTGLGLSTVYGLVQQMEGTIEIQTEEEEGTAFLVYLPVSQKPLNRVISGSVDNLETLSFKGYRVLLAEDEPDLLLLLKEMLERRGMEVLTAANGNEALLVQEECEGKIDFLLTDVVMPELGGVDLAELLTALRPETQVIFMSGYPAHDQMARLSNLEDACFLAKPVEYDVLMRLIYERLDGGGGNSGASSSQNAPHWQSADLKTSNGDLS